MEGGTFEKSNPIAFANIWSQHREVTCVMTAREENVLALSIIGKQAKHLFSYQAISLDERKFLNSVKRYL
jgi:hypothetical protein